VIRDGDAGGGRRWQHRHSWQPTWNFTDDPLIWIAINNRDTIFYLSTGVITIRYFANVPPLYLQINPLPSVQMDKPSRVAGRTVAVKRHLKRRFSCWKLNDQCELSAWS
jgi:hypothetical protein